MSFDVITVCLIARPDTVEEKIMQTQQHKARLADELAVEGDGFFRSLGREGMLGLVGGMMFALGHCVILCRVADAT